MRIGIIDSLWPVAVIPIQLFLLFRGTLGGVHEHSWTDLPVHTILLGILLESKYYYLLEVVYCINTKQQLPPILSHNLDFVKGINSFCRANIEALTVESLHNHIHNTLLPQLALTIKEERNLH